jgi:hypothetical protein
MGIGITPGGPAGTATGGGAAGGAIVGTAGRVAGAVPVGIAEITDVGTAEIVAVDIGGTAIVPVDPGGGGAAEPIANIEELTTQAKPSMEVSMQHKTG